MTSREALASGLLIFGVSAGSAFGAKAGHDYFSTFDHSADIEWDSTLKTLQLEELEKMTPDDPQYNEAQNNVEILTTQIDRSKESLNENNSAVIENSIKGVAVSGALIALGSAIAFFPLSKRGEFRISQPEQQPVIF